eukprot:PLAT3541.4.p1 GENE.PLAT3541.4~~PLAT3541.4.p1  ORF type:complete len:1370 (-),score=495.48 PLAT3541.4:66-4175(-)
MFDKDKKGHLSFLEVQDLLKAVGLELSGPKMLKYFRACNVSGDGTISRDELKMLLYVINPLDGNTLSFKPQQLLSPLDAFDIIDVGKVGFIGEDSFALLLEFLGFGFDVAQVEELWATYAPSSGAMTYPIFRHAWLHIANAKEEIKKRGVVPPARAPLRKLRRMLERRLLDEESKEDIVLAEGLAYFHHIPLVRARRVLVTKAKLLAEKALSEALCAGGQVYMFGESPMQELSGTTARLRFQHGDVVQDLWTKRVAPERWLEGRMTSKYEPDELFYRKHLLSTPFYGTVCAVNTAGLWCRRIKSISLGTTAAVALSEDGRMFVWGGRNEWEEVELAGSIYDEAHPRPPMTPRSRAILTESFPMPPKKEDTRVADKQAWHVARWRHVLSLLDVSYEVPATLSEYDYLKGILLPKVDFDFIVYSLQLRLTETVGFNKLELIELLADALEVEEQLLEEAELRKLRMMEQRVHSGGHVHMAKAIMAVWTSLKERQNAMKLQQREDAWAEEIRQAEENEEAWRRRRAAKTALMEEKEVLHSARGRGVRIPVSGFTPRGPKERDLPGFSVMRQVHCSSHFAAAVHASGDVYTWGSNTYGRLGHGDRKDRHTPTRVASLEKQPVQHVSLGYMHAAAVTIHGQLLVWGSGVTGKLGLGAPGATADFSVPSPVQLHLPSSMRVRTVSCGNAHTAAVTRDGRLWVWGCGDGGRLGLGADRQETLLTPVMVESLRDIDVFDVACGSSHTLVLTSIVEDFSTYSNITGGDVYACGAAAAIGSYLPTFQLVEEMRGKHVKQICTGYAHSAMLTLAGEVYTWGSNMTGACCAPRDVRFVDRPSLVRCLYTAPENLALGKKAQQSSIFAGNDADRAVDGSRDGLGEDACTCTQIDHNAWWEVDLGKLALIESVCVWNREDLHPDRSHDKYEIQKRLFPCWVLISVEPFPSNPHDLALGLSLKKAKAVAVEKVRFTENLRQSRWKLPRGTMGRYVRVQLESRNYLHIAQVEVFGSFHIHNWSGRVRSISTGPQMTAVVTEPSLDRRSLESNYIKAVRPDVMAMRILQQYSTYYHAFDKHGQCPWGSTSCLLCTQQRCSLCDLIERFPLPDYMAEREEAATKHGSHRNTLAAVIDAVSSEGNKPLMDAALLHELQRLKHEAAEAVAAMNAEEDDLLAGAAASLASGATLPPAAAAASARKSSTGSKRSKRSSRGSRSSSPAVAPAGVQPPAKAKGLFSRLGHGLGRLLGRNKKTRRSSAVIAVDSSDDPAERTRRTLRRRFRQAGKFQLGPEKKRTGVDEEEEEEEDPLAAYGGLLEPTTVLDELRERESTAILGFAAEEEDDSDDEDVEGDEGGDYEGDDYDDDDDDDDDDYDEDEEYESFEDDD